ncbi:MAG TPA: VOC family protein [candidate division Zixibacteria bacterium]|nr:VOC family protein [candidate division Zixibacteria bacterium]
MPKIQRLSHVVLYVRDLDKMTAFYRDVLGLVEYRAYPGRMVFMTPDPRLDDHQLALVKGREGEAKIVAHVAWQVETPADVKAFYERFKALGVPIDHCVSHAYEVMGNTVSCYFLDPEGNRLEVYALVARRDAARVNRPLDLDRSVDEIIAQASGLPRAVS